MDLNPAVSDTITGNPPKSRETSNTSRVVPGKGVTIAASRCAYDVRQKQKVKRLKRELYQEN